MYLVDDNKNLADYASYVFDLCHPVGEIYIRYPGQSSPQDLYKRGTWNNISNEFAGLFFRAEGGNANPFEGGSQEDKIRNIRGSISGASGDSAYLRKGQGCYTYESRHRSPDIGEFGSWNAGYYHIFDANSNSGSTIVNPMAGHADGSEIRPVNTTVQIWKRTG